MIGLRKLATRRHRGQALVEFALVVPVLVVVLLGAVDFGRVMQARVTAEAATRVGASWGATLANANQLLDPVYDDVKYCPSLTPSCNLEARACAEAAGLPGYSGGPDLTTKYGNTYHDCASNYPSSTNTKAGVCTPSAAQSNPWLEVQWTRADGTVFNPAAANVKVGDRVALTGTYCFNTFFTWPAIPRQITFAVTSTFTVQP